MTFSPDDIEIKEFVPTLRGYDRAEVRAYLRAVAEDVRRLEERLNEREIERAAPSSEPLATSEAAGDTGSAATAPPRFTAPLDVPFRVQEPVAMRDLEHAVRDLTFAIQAIAARTGVLDRVASTVRPRRTEPVAASRTDAPVPDRRGPNRPWANVERSAAPGEPVDWSLPATARRSTRLDRSSENRSMIERFLPRALGLADGVDVDADEYTDELADVYLDGDDAVGLAPDEDAARSGAPADDTSAEGPGGAVLPFVRAV